MSASLHICFSYLDLDRSWVSYYIKVHILGRKWLECSLCSIPQCDKHGNRAELNFRSRILKFRLRLQKPRSFEASVGYIVIIFIIFLIIFIIIFLIILTIFFNNIFSSFLFSKKSTPKTRFSEPRFSEILNLMNKPQLPFSYFTLYSDSI